MALETLSFTDATGGKLYNLYDYTAYQGDLLGALKSACDARGIKFGLCYSITRVRRSGFTSTGFAEGDHDVGGERWWSGCLQSATRHRARQAPARCGRGLRRDVVAGFATVRALLDLIDRPAGPPDSQRAPLRLPTELVVCGSTATSHAD